MTKHHSPHQVCFYNIDLKRNIVIQIIAVTHWWRAGCWRAAAAKALSIAAAVIAGRFTTGKATFPAASQQGQFTAIPLQNNFGGIFLNTLLVSPFRVCN